MKKKELTIYHKSNWETLQVVDWEVLSNGNLFVILDKDGSSLVWFHHQWDRAEDSEFYVDKTESIATYDEIKYTAWGEEVEGPTVTLDTVSDEETSSPDGERHTYDTGAVRSKDADHVRYDLISPIAMRRLAETYAEGAVKYGEWNWQKGFPVSSLMNHAINHLFLFLAGDASEDHLAHAFWNIGTAMHFEETREDMMDIPSRWDDDHPHVVTLDDEDYEVGTACSCGDEPQLPDDFLDIISEVTNAVIERLRKERRDASA